MIMKTLTCDICNNVIEEPSPARNYWHIVHRDICESCKDKLEFLIKPTIRQKSPFSYDWFYKQFLDNVEKSIQKGKVDVKIVI